MKKKYIKINSENVNACIYWKKYIKIKSENVYACKIFWIKWYQVKIIQNL